MSPYSDELTRRDCLKHIAAGAAAVGLVGVQPAIGDKPGNTRQVLVSSDTHIGFKADGVDGAEWLERALSELRENRVQIDYAMALGDISHHATADAFRKYVELRDKSGIDRWFELAGNHEYGPDGLKDYETIVRSAKPYAYVDGNIAWFFISDEAKGVPGNISDETDAWLKKSVADHQDKIVIVCSHQLVHDTIRQSKQNARHIHPKEKIAELLEAHRVDLWMCGHEHHRPYSHEEITRKDGTTFINVASMSHAYGSKQSQSFLLEFAEGARKIVARRRVHDTQSFAEDYQTEIPLDRAIQLGKHA